MIVGVGIDVCAIGRIEAALGRWGDRIWNRILREPERAALGQRVDRATALAGRFAAKEACFKALGGPAAVSWHDIEVRAERWQPPALVLHGAAVAAATERAVTHLHLSISHDAGVAAAIVVLEARSPTP